jgi:hypothetical protein
MQGVFDRFSTDRPAPLSKSHIKKADGILVDLLAVRKAMEGIVTTSLRSRP